MSLPDAVLVPSPTAPDARTAHRARLLAGAVRKGLSAADRAVLATLVEDGARVLRAVRYGSVFRAGACSVLLNPDSPEPWSNVASALDGSPGRVERTLELLPEIFAEAGRSETVVLDSPTSLPELSMLAEETGYEAVEELSVVVLTDPRRLVEGEPGRIVRPLAEHEELELGVVLGGAYGWSERTRQSMSRVLGFRLDDPRFVAVAAQEAGELVGVATGFVGAGLGEVSDVAVLPEFRGRSTGRALASAVAATCLARGAPLVWAMVDAGGQGERFFADLGFEPAYDTVAYVRGTDEPPRFA